MAMTNLVTIMKFKDIPMITMNKIVKAVVSQGH